MATIKMPDGQSFQLDDEIAKDDATLRDALKAAYPDAGTATFTREGGKDGKALVVRVTKKAGTKGSVVADLLVAPATINPAVAMQRRLEALERAGGLDHLKMLSLKGEIEQAVREGSDDVGAVNGARAFLRDAPAESDTRVPMGF